MKHYLATKQNGVANFKSLPVYLPAGSTIVQNGLSATESINLMIQGDENEGFVSAKDSAGAAIVMDNSTKSQVTINGAGIYRVEFGATIAVPTSVIAYPNTRL